MASEAKNRSGGYYKKGLGSSNHFEVGAFLSLISKSDHPDIQLECIAMRAISRDGIAILGSMLCQSSACDRGKLWIDSADPFRPRIPFSLFKHHPR